MKIQHLLAPALIAGLSALLGAAPQQDLQGAGQVAVHSSTTPFTATGSAWTNVPGLKGAITLPRGGDLAITITINGQLSVPSARMLARVKVGTRTAFPWSMPFMHAIVNRRNTACTFFVRGLPAGTHQVAGQVQMLSGWATLVERSMIMRFADGNSRGIRMGMAHRGALSRSGSFGRSNVPGMVTTINTPWPAKLLIQVSGDFGCQPRKRVFVLPVIDGKPQNDRIMETQASVGCTALVQTSGQVKAGNHTVQLQWYADDSASFSVASMVVVAVRDQINNTSGNLHQDYIGPHHSTTSTAFVPIPGIAGGNLWVPSRCDLAVAFSGSMSGNPGSRFRMECKVDNKVVPHGLADTMTCWTIDWRQMTQLYVVRNLERGWHNVSLRWATNSGGQVNMTDRSLAVTAVIGQRPLLVTSTESNRPPAYKYGGKFASTVVDTSGSKRTFKKYVRDNLFGKTFPGVADWFAENARGHMNVVEAGIVGPNLKLFDEQTYRSLPNAFTAMKLEALTYADVEFDYSYYDRDGDGKVKPDELYALVVMYQDSLFGEVRPLTTYNTRDGVTVDYAGGIATAYLPDFKSFAQLGVVCHELSHLLLRTGDMYETSWDPTAPGPFSIMDQYAPMGHLDPLHKLKQGRWYEAYDQGADRWLTLPPVSRGGSLVKLRDPNGHHGEYFLVENRAAANYNVNLPSHGLAVWHCDEKRLPNWRTAVEIEPRSGRTNPINYRNYLFTGTEFGFHRNRDVYSYSTHTNLRWHDNQASNLGLWAIERQADGSIRVFIDTTKPGVLAQFEQRKLYLGGSGWAKTKVRIVNTSSFRDTFTVTVTLQGQASWFTKTVTLNPYQAVVYDLDLKVHNPNLPDVKVTASSTNSSTTDTAKVYYTLLHSGTGALGTTSTLHLVNPEQKGAPYTMGVSGGNSPGFMLPGNLHVPLNVDPLLTSFHTAPAIFDKFFGILGLDGLARAYVHIPNIPGIRGIDLYFAYVTADKSGNFTSVSNGVGFRIR